MPEQGLYVYGEQSMPRQMNRPPATSSPLRILFVCMGNICRSPLAEAAFRYRLQEYRLTDRFELDSAATHAYHIGSAPDPRSQQVALARGIDISGQRARQICARDYVEFDYILAMDESNLADIFSQAVDPVKAEIALFTSYSAPPLQGRQVPDPYYGGADGFKQVLEMVEQASNGLLQKLRLIPDK